MSAGQIVKAQISDSRPYQPFHFVAELVKHAPDLSVDSLPQDDFKEIRFERLDALEPGALAVEHDAAQ